MRRKSLWKNLMLATALTVVLGTAPVTAFAADVDSTVTETEQTVPEAEAIPETDTVADATNVTINVSSGAVTFDGSSDIVLTYTITADGDFMVSNDGPMLGESMAYPLYEKVSETEHRFTITKDTLKRLIDMGMEDDMSVVFNPNYCVITGEDTLHYFPKVTLTYDAGNDNGGDNGNGDNQKPENPDPENPDNGNGDNNGGDNNGGDNNNGQTPENPDNGNGDNNGGQTPETPDNGNGQTPETPDNGNSNTNNQNNTQNNTNNNQTTAKPTKTSPKTGDATATLPVAGTGLASLGVALATVLRKRK